MVQQLSGPNLEDDSGDRVDCCNSCKSSGCEGGEDSKGKGVDVGEGDGMKERAN